MGTTQSASRSNESTIGKFINGSKKLSSWAAPMQKQRRKSIAHGVLAEPLLIEPVPFQEENIETLQDPRSPTYGVSQNGRRRTPIARAA